MTVESHLRAERADPDKRRPLRSSRPFLRRERGEESEADHIAERSDGAQNRRRPG